MDSTLTDEAPSRLEALRAVRCWRARHAATVRALAWLVGVAAVLAWGFLAGPAQAGVQIDFDPMRPPAAPAAAASAATADAPATAAAMPTLRITRASGSGAYAALVDDAWVRRGDVVAGHRVLGVRADSIDLVNLNDPTQRLTLRLNPVAVERSSAPRTAAAWAPLALEKQR